MKNKEIKTKKYRTKISFWASYCALEFKDKRLEKLFNDLLEIQDKLGKITNKFFKDFTKYKKETMDSKIKRKKCKTRRKTTSKSIYR